VKVLVLEGDRDDSDCCGSEVQNSELKSSRNWRTDFDRTTHPQFHWESTIDG